ncbi:MAG: hypothetical protein QNJ12_22300 [Ilumatobacter sp.]|uniref:hypothetical protein n=1 Tax=Ilumatobacter sp. TaxID=1967498 RepID=UPI002627172C|nr:hypothetical protein [Ilumatobacter sp.]MDJ0771534.1 hypothetical protein [Ilumatobacter sp.]
MITGGLTSVGGVECYRIDGIEEMEPFLTTVVSESDLWMFVSSNGALSAGRIDADHALFPYVTDDQIHRAAGAVGPVTVIARTHAGRRELWRPLHTELTPGCTRSLAKSVLGDRLIFEEEHTDWRLRFRATWMPSGCYGWVRTVELVDEGGDGADLEVLDGLLDVMPAGVDALTEQIRSNLVDAYKRSETGPWGTLAIYNVESLITDRAEPGEALTATTVWSWGFESADLDLDSRAVTAMIDGDERDPRSLLTGRPGAYLLRGPVHVTPGGSTSWSIVADTGLGHPEVLATVRIATDPHAGKPVLDDVQTGSDGLRDLLASGDAFQSTADPIADAHHLSNVLFNSMRGGVFPFGHRVPARDLAAFVASHHDGVAARHGAWLAGLDEWIDAVALRGAALETGDGDLVRLVLEYLPLTFSRRHGDPSRPWNQFSIRVRDDVGDQLLSFEGNWRDIFQNWEALLRSFPAYFANVVAKFVNASTLDGYNPYRISRAGIDWEAPDPDDPWGNIGYWGDHQIVYLLRLLEAWDQHEPGAIGDWLDRAVFVYADVPYRVADHAEMVLDPRNTISFDHDRADEIERREQAVGADGRLVVDAGGELLRVGLAEKLLVPALGKLSSLVPGGGIWMNTQRPEWNDANNALAGPGLSMVTLAHLRRYLAFVRDHLADARTVTLTSTVATWLDDLADVLEEFAPRPTDATTRRAVVDALGSVRAAQHRRGRERTGFTAVDVPVDRVGRLLSRAIEHLDASIRVARRADGLYHSYNLVSFPSADTAQVDHLGPMLEGQVAALSSGVLDAHEALALIDALFESDMYRADLDTFVLYPVVELPPFLERNTVPAELWSTTGLDEPPRRVVTTDLGGGLRFRPEATNADALAALLAETDLADADRAAVQRVYEEVFRHRSFTGRSGSMYGYEGIGSVYWHMVAKLLLAVQEAYWSAVDQGAAPDVAEQLVHAYRRIRSGLGFRKEPGVYGAFPTDCYSHTPSHAGAQQPGMTGQVKEEVLTRFGELGLRLVAGHLSLWPGLIGPEEVLPPRNAADGSASLTVCGVEMTIQRGDADRVALIRSDGAAEVRDELSLTADATRSVLARDGGIARVEWTIGPATLDRWSRTA